MPRGGKNYFWVCHRGVNGYDFLNILVISDHMQKKLAQKIFPKKFGCMSKLATPGYFITMNRSFGSFGRYSTKMPNNEWSADLPSPVSLGLNLWFYQLLYYREYYSISKIPLSCTPGLKIAERRDRVWVWQCSMKSQFTVSYLIILSIKIKKAYQYLLKRFSGS